MTPAKRGKGNKPNAGAEGEEETLSDRRASMSWAQRLKRVFNIDVEGNTVYTDFDQFAAGVAEVSTDPSPRK